MLIDTHCHLDAPVFQADLSAVEARARQAGVQAFVVPAVDVASFDRVRHLVQHFSGSGYALGIHPMRVDRADEADLACLRLALRAARDDPRLVAVGEIGLDYYVPDLDRSKMLRFFVNQLQLAVEFGLPVIVHSRRAVEDVLKHLRQVRPVGGIAHAFHGSLEQARALIRLNMALGFGGVLTWPRASHVRHLAVSVPLEHCVLETDAPDMPPLGCPPGRNEPAHVAGIAQVWADLRAVTPDLIAQATTDTALRVLPKLAALMRR